LDSVGVVEVLAGLALVLVTAGDAVSTLVTTRRRRGQRWPTPVYYRWSWRAWRAIGRLGGPEWREGFLGVYGPLSLLGLLVFWVVLLVAGWGAVWWGPARPFAASTVTSTPSTSPGSGSSPSASATWCRPAAWPACSSSSRPSWACSPWPC
jgi:hypothetical protein